MLYKVENNNGKVVMWNCECQCDNKTLKSVSQSNLVSGKSKSCDCIRKEILNKKSEDKRRSLIGETFGCWTVIGDDGIKRNNSSRTSSYLKCICSCENETVRSVSLGHLTRGDSTNCGCIRPQKLYDLYHKTNDYDLSGDFGIGWTTNSQKEFYFDLDDYEKIKNYCWMDSGLGYVVANEHFKKRNKNLIQIRMHRFVLNCPDDKEVDHIYHNTFDNRKNKLRIVTRQQNACNQLINSKNTSGYKGVKYNKSSDRWISYIKMNRKTMQKSFKFLEDAISQRSKWELEYFGEYRLREDSDTQ